MTLQNGVVFTLVMKVLQVNTDPALTTVSGAVVKVHEISGHRSPTHFQTICSQGSFIYTPILSRLPSPDTFL